MEIKDQILQWQIQHPMTSVTCYCALCGYFLYELGYGIGKFLAYVLPV